jgi:hypothetical protein
MPASPATGERLLTGMTTLAAFIMALFAGLVYEWWQVRQFRRRAKIY